MRNSYSGALSARGGVVRALYGRAADPDSPRPTRPREDAFAALMSGGKRARTAEREKVSVPLSALMPCGRAPKDHKGDSAGLLRELWMGQRSGWGTGARAASAASRDSQTPSRVCRMKTTNVRSPLVGRAVHQSRIERGLGMRAGDEVLNFKKA